MNHDPDAHAALAAVLRASCADDPDLSATVAALDEAGETDLLRLIRDFRDALGEGEILARHGPADRLDERLRVVHRAYVDAARASRESAGRPARARRCYESRMLSRRDNYRALLGDVREAIPAGEREGYERLVRCARDRVPYDELPQRLGLDAGAVEEQILRLRQRFEDGAGRRKVRADSSARGGASDA